MNPKPVCRYNKFGYCKFSDKCRLRHNDVICSEKNCNLFNCEKRHPKMCTFHRDFGRCKFTTYCRYNHEKHKDIKENNDKIKEMETRLHAVENKKNDQKSDKIKNLETRLENLQENINNKDQEFEKKINMFENKIETLLKVLEEKDLVINKLGKKIDDFEGKVKVIASIEKELKEFVKINENQDVRDVHQKKKDEEEKFQCQNCDFKATSTHGLKVHIKRKHTSYLAEKLPIKCDICDEKFKYLDDKQWEKERIDEHRIAHSYTSGSSLQFKCEECNFWGPNRLTMEMHVRRKHSELISCGMCMLVVKSEDILETHLVTCEIYKCNECRTKFTTVSDIKKHIKENHNGKNISLTHLKSNRKNSEFFDDDFHNNSKQLLK